MYPKRFSGHDFEVFGYTADVKSSRDVSAFLPESLVERDSDDDIVVLGRHRDDEDSLRLLGWERLETLKPKVETWNAHTSAFDGVQAIALTVNQPRAVSYIASEVHVAENTARAQLERLADLNVLLKYDVDGKTGTRRTRSTPGCKRYGSYSMNTITMNSSR